MTDSSVNAIPTGQTWYLYRHGIATHDPVGYRGQERIAGLLPEARPDLERLGQYLANQGLANSRAFTSPVARCVESTKIVSEFFPLDYTVDERLTEWYQESFEQLVTRLSAFMTEVQTQAPQAVVVCIHGTPMAVLCHLLTGRTPSPLDNYDYPPPAGLRIVTAATLEQVVFSI